MFCPKCGKDSISEDKKFCPGCGLSLASVKAAIAEPGNLPAPAALDGNDARRKGLLRGAKSLGTGLALGALGYSIMLAIFLIQDGRPWPYKSDDPVITLLTPFKWLFIACYFLCPTFSLYGIVRMLYALIFEKGSLRKTLHQASKTELSELSAPKQGMALSASGRLLFAAWQAGKETDSLAAPLSVTERTTRSLQNQ